MDSSTVVLGLRVALALACVFGLLWWAGRRMAGTPAGRRARASSLEVVTRQSVGQKASVALVEIEGRRLLLILWLGFPRKDGDRNDCYAVFSRLVQRGELPEDWESLQRGG